MKVWIVELRRDESDNNNLVEEGRESPVDVTSGSEEAVLVASLKKTIFPDYDFRTLGKVTIYVRTDTHTASGCTSNSTTAPAPAPVASNSTTAPPLAPAAENKQFKWEETTERDALLCAQGEQHSDSYRTYTYGILDLNTYKEKEEQQERPNKRFKIRDARENTKVEASKCVDLNVGVGGGALTILTPALLGTVRYYGRTGMEDLFEQLADPRDNEENFNVEFIGAPGTGKSNLVWAVAEYLGTSQGLNVVWVSRRVSTEVWNVIQFCKGSVYSFEDVPATLSALLKFPEFAGASVLILDTPISISDQAERENGAAAYAWASKTGVRGSRIGSRRVIHVSSLGASTEKAEERRQLSLHEIMIRPWTRQDFIKAMDDEQLKKKVCATLSISDPTKARAEDIVDSKFFFSGINAHWFFNYSIKDIKDECKSIVSRMTSTTTANGDRHREAVNSALQRYWLGDRAVVLFTSSYLACLMGKSKQTQGQQQFLENFPLIKDYLGNGAPGEIFEADFAIHLQQCHDLADAQHAVMGEKAQRVDVALGEIDDTTPVAWPTGKLYKLPAVSTQGVSHQILPNEATRDLQKKEKVAQWFIPENKSQPFPDFFVLVPDKEEWQLRAIQNTVGKKYSTDLEQLKRIVGGILDSGYILCDKVVVAYVIEDNDRQQNIGKMSSSNLTMSRTTGTRSSSTGNESQIFTVEALRVKFTRAGATPR